MYKTDILISKWVNKKINKFFQTKLSTKETDIFMFTGIWHRGYHIRNESKKFRQWF